MRQLTRVKSDVLLRGATLTVLGVAGIVSIFLIFESIIKPGLYGIMEIWPDYDIHNDCYKTSTDVSSGHYFIEYGCAKNEECWNGYCEAVTYEDTDPNKKLDLPGTITLSSMHLEENPSYRHILFRQSDGCEVARGFVTQYTRKIAYTRYTDRVWKSEAAYLNGDPVFFSSSYPVAYSAIASGVRTYCPPDPLYPDEESGPCTHINGIGVCLY